MIPEFTPHYAAYLSPADTKQRPKGCVRPASLRVQVAHSGHRKLGHLRLGITFSMRLTSLGNHIGRVICVSPNKQMGGVTADRIVALVANQSSRLKESAREQKRRPMRPRASEQPIALFAVATPRPRPTGIWSAALVNVPPEKYIGRGDRPISEDVTSNKPHRGTLDNPFGENALGIEVCRFPTTTMTTAKRNICSHVFHYSAHHNETQYT